MRLCMVLLYTTGLYCSHSSLEYPVSCIIFICFTIVLFPDSPAPVGIVVLLFLHTRSNESDYIYLPSSNNLISLAARSPSALRSLSIFFDLSVASLSPVVLTAQPIVSFQINSILTLVAVHTPRHKRLHPLTENHCRHCRQLFKI